MVFLWLLVLFIMAEMKSTADKWSSFHLSDVINSSRYESLQTSVSRQTSVPVHEGICLMRFFAFVLIVINIIDSRPHNQSSLKKDITIPRCLQC